MPTAAKLVAAVVFAAVCWVAAEAFKPLLPDDTQFGSFSWVCAAIGALSGWLVMGSRVGRGLAMAMAFGFQAGVVALFWALVLFSGREMVVRSLNHRYGDAFEAILGVFEIAYEYLLLLPGSAVLLILFAGSLLGGLATELASRRWK